MTTPLIEPYYVPFFVDELQGTYQIETGSRQTGATTNTTRHYLPRGAYMATVAWSGASGVKMRIVDGADAPRDIGMIPSDPAHSGDRQRASAVVQFAVNAPAGGYIMLQNDPSAALTGMGGRKLLLQIIPMPLYASA